MDSLAILKGYNDARELIRRKQFDAATGLSFVYAQLGRILNYIDSEALAVHQAN
jgi:hypothetical protein